MKSIDCKIMSIMINDIIRQKTVLKIEDEDYVFIRRAFNQKSYSLKEKEDARKSKNSDDSDEEFS